MKEYRPYIVIFILASISMLLMSCIRVELEDCDTFERDVYRNGYYVGTEIETICYY